MLNYNTIIRRVHRTNYRLYALGKYANKIRNTNPLVFNEDMTFEECQNWLKLYADNLPNEDEVQSIINSDIKIPEVINRLRRARSQVVI